MFGLLLQIGSSRIFDPEVYIRNRENNFRNQRDSRMRNFCGSGKILAHEPKTAKEVTEHLEPPLITESSQPEFVNTSSVPDQLREHREEALDLQ